MKCKPQKDYWFVGIQLFLFLLYTLDIDLYTVKTPTYLVYLSYGLFALATLFGILAVLQLNTNLSPFPSPKKGAYLVTSGVFKFSRHPIYTAIIFGGLSYGVIQSSWFKVAIAYLLWLLFYFKSSYEEKLLSQKFPEYADYKTKVGRFFPKLF